VLLFFRRKPKGLKMAIIEDSIELKRLDI